MTISPKHIVAYSQCPFKASLLMFTDNDGIPCEYLSLIHDEAEKNKKEFIKELDADKAKYDSISVNQKINYKNLSARVDAVIRKKNCVDEQKEIEPVLVVGTHKVQKADKLHLSFIGYILSKICEKPIETGVIISSPHNKQHTIHLNKLYPKLQKILTCLNTWIISGDPSPCLRILNKHCVYCQFQTQCAISAREEDHLSLLKGISALEIEQQKNKGIFTVTQFSYTYRYRKPPKTVTQVKYSHALKALAIRESKIHVASIPKLPKIGMETAVISLDVEGIPDRDFYYLIGVAIRKQTNTETFSFWANQEAEEKSIWTEFLEIIKQYQDFVLIHYGAYETKFIRKMNQRYSSDRDELILQKLQENSFNILSAIYGHIYFPTYSNSLKEIEAYLGYRWSIDDANGIQSLIWRMNWESAQDIPTKSQLIQYNTEDCFANLHLLDNITQIIQKLHEEDSDDIVQVKTLKKQGYKRWGYPDFQNDDFQHINSLAYFDYQREKIYLRTNPNIKKAIKSGYKRLKQINTVDKRATIIPQWCPYCHHDGIRQVYGKRSKKTIDLKFLHNGIKKWVIEYESGNFFCKRCKKNFTPERFKKVPYYGDKLVKWAMDQHITYGVSLQNIINILMGSFNVKASLIEVCEFKERLAQDYRETYKEIKETLITGHLLHVDETKASGKAISSGYVWVFASMDSVFYMFRPSRKADFLKELLADFEGVLVSDFYAGYDSLLCAQQKCLIHLIRDLNNDLLAEPYNDELRGIIRDFGALLRNIMETIDVFGLTKYHLAKHRKDVETFYKELEQGEYSSDLALKYQKRFDKNRQKLFTFLDYDGIPWNNNNAEHAIRPFAKYRRRINKSYSQKNLEYFLVLLSIQQTCEYRGIPFLDFLKAGKKSINEYTKFIMTQT